MNLFESPDMVFGLEEEFGSNCSRIGRKNSPLNFKPTQKYNQFLLSGGRIYLDVHDFYSRGLVEYCSPEHTSVRNCVAAIIAGRQITNASTEGMRHDELELRSGFSWELPVGSHENYQSSIGADALTRYMVPYLLTRHLLTGSGGVNEHEEPIISPRLTLVRGTSNKFSASQSLYRIRRLQEDAEDTQRIEITCGDHSVSDTALFMRIGMTALVLRLIENNLAPYFPYQFTSFRQDIENLNGINPCEWVLEGAGGVPAIQVQRAYCNAAERYLSHTDEASLVIHLWSKTLDLLESGNISELSQHTEWANRLLNQKIENPVYATLRDKLDLKIISESMIADASDHPLDVTRAKARVRVLAELLDKPKGELTSLKVGWDAIIAKQGGCATRYEFPRPNQDYVDVSTY